MDKSKITTWIEGENAWEAGLELLKSNFSNRNYQLFSRRRGNNRDKGDLRRFFKQAIKYQPPPARWGSSKSTKPPKKIKTEAPQKKVSPPEIEEVVQVVKKEFQTPLLEKLIRERQTYYNKASRFFNQMTNPDITTEERKGFWLKFQEWDEKAWAHKHAIDYYKAHGKLPPYLFKKEIVLSDFKTSKELQKYIVNKLRPKVTYWKKQTENSGGIAQEENAAKLQTWEEKLQNATALRDKFKQNESEK